MTASVETLRLSDQGGGGGRAAADGAGVLARAVALHLAGKREEALEQLQRAAAANQGSAESVPRHGPHRVRTGPVTSAAIKSYRALTRLKPQYAMGGSTWRSAWSAPEPGTRPPRPSTTPARSMPGNLDAHLGLAVCYMRLEDPKSALRGFERCLELAPDHEDALFGKGAALQALGHRDEAAKIYTSAARAQSGVRGAALQPDSDRHGASAISTWCANTPSACWTCARIPPWRWKAWRRGPAPPDDQALTAKFCTLLVSAVARPFRRLVQPGAGASEGRPLEAGGRRPTRKRSKCGRSPPKRFTNLGIVREQLGDPAGARSAYERAAQGRSRRARAGVEPGPVAGARRTVGRGRALVPAACSRRRPRKRRRASAWATCGSGAAISAPRPKRSKAA